MRTRLILGGWLAFLASLYLLAYRTGGAAGSLTGAECWFSSLLSFKAIFGGGVEALLAAAFVAVQPANLVAVAAPLVIPLDGARRTPWVAVAMTLGLVGTVVIRVMLGALDHRGSFE